MSIILALLTAIVGLAIFVLRVKEDERHKNLLRFFGVAVFLLSLGTAALEAATRQKSAEQMSVLRTNAQDAATRAEKAVVLLESAKQSNDELRGEADSLRKQLDEATKMVANTNKEVEHAKEEVRKVTDARDRLTTELDALVKKIESGAGGLADDLKREAKAAEEKLKDIFKR